MIISHRGNSGKYPENTLETFRIILENPNIVDGIEFDIMLTKDGKIIIFHDDTFDRVCFTHGKVCDTEYNNLPLICYNYKIPLFEDLLHIISSRDRPFDKKFIINIEIKDTKQLLVNLLVQVLDFYNAKLTQLNCEIIISSFNHTLIYTNTQILKLYCKKLALLHDFPKPYYDHAYLNFIPNYFHHKIRLDTRADGYYTYSSVGRITMYDETKIYFVDKV